MPPRFLSTHSLIQFLQKDLAIPRSSVDVAVNQLADQPPHLLPMVLWQYGLVTLEQLDRIFDWMELQPRS
jgi:hypothetical protein